MANTALDYKNTAIEIPAVECLAAKRSAGDSLEEVHLKPFLRSYINHRTIGDLQDYNGLWAKKLIVDDVQMFSPFDHDRSDFERLQQHYDYFSKQVMAGPNQTFFSNYKEKYLLLRASLCSVAVGANQQKTAQNAYGWYVTDSPVSIKLRMTLVDPESNLAIASFLHENIGPQSLRKMDGDREMEEVSHLMVNSLKRLCDILPELAGFEERKSRLAHADLMY